MAEPQATDGAAASTAPAVRAASAPAQPVRRPHTLGRMVKNTVALAIGGNVVALARLVVLGIILRGFGAATSTKSMT